MILPKETYHFGDLFVKKQRKFPFVSYSNYRQELFEFVAWRQRIKDPGY